MHIHGECFQDLELCQNIFAQRGEGTNITWTRVFFFDFLQQAPNFVWSTAVCSASFRRDLLLLLLNPYNIMSAVTALQAATQLEVSCLHFCVMRDDTLAVYRPAHFASLAAAGIV